MTFVVGDPHRDRVALHRAERERGRGLHNLAAAADTAATGADVIVRFETGCAAAPLIVDPYPHARIGRDIVRPPGAAAMLRDDPDAGLIGATGQRHPARLARFAPDGLQLDHQRRADTEPVKRRDQRVEDVATELSLELELAQSLAGFHG